MKQLLFILLTILSFGALKAQGLENIIVEKYYVSNAADAAASVGTLPVGSVTYRVYVDMVPNYALLSIYGVTEPASGKIDTLRFSSSLPFFNNEDRGDLYAYTIGNGFLDDNTVMLDSWFTAGRIGATSSAAGYQGVLKPADAGSILSASSIYNNVDPTAGIAIKTNDGLITPGMGFSWTPTPNFDGLFGPVFGNVSLAGSSVSTIDAAIGNVGANPFIGPTADNRVLIGQFTTAGTFEFSLNMQLKNLTTNATEEWVARTPQTGQFIHPSLLRESNAAPTVTITAPAGGSTFTAGQALNVTATAADANGTVTKVDFIYNGTKISDLTSPYSAGFIAATGASTILARAFDNLGDSTTASINIIVGVNNSPTILLGTFPVPSYTDSTVVLTATAMDSDGTVAQVEFFVNNVSIGVDLTAPYSFIWMTPSVKGNYTIKAEATDNLGAKTTSTAVINLLSSSGNKYEVKEVAEVCNNETICVPINALQLVSEVIGYDLVLKYNKNKVVPTGIIKKGVLADPSLVETSYSINSNQGKMLISVYFNTNAPSASRFQGLGDLICVEFSKKPAFLPTDNVEFIVESLQESYITGVISEAVDTNSFITFKDTILNSSLKFWADGSPIAYTSGTNLITNIFGTAVDCTAKSATSVFPNANGEFTHNLNKGLSLSIERNIAPITDVQAVINGFDALQVRKVLIEDVSFRPSIYQAIAMDVNLDGVISAGDASQINQRAVLRLSEYRQKWNYNDNGTKKPGQGDSKDWLFVEESKTFILPEFTISANYPNYDGVGYNNDHIPTLPFCVSTPVSDWARCSVIGTEVYMGILIGDVNGNYQNLAANTELRSIDEVSLDLNNAKIVGNQMIVPVFVNSTNDIYAVDFALKYDESKLKFTTVTTSDHVQSLAYMNEDDKTLRFTSNALTSYDTNKAVANIIFDVTDAHISSVDFTAVAGYLNGDKVDFNISNNPTSTEDNESDYAVYPNPTNGILNIIAKNDSNVELLDMTGKKVMTLGSVTKNSLTTFDISNLHTGIYILKISNHNFVSNKKIFVTK